MKVSGQARGTGRGRGKFQMKWKGMKCISHTRSRALKTPDPRERPRIPYPFFKLVSGAGRGETRPNFFGILSELLLTLLCEELRLKS